VHGDWAYIDQDGFWYIHGRSDDTLKLAGKRVGPAEIESVLVGHPAVNEAAAVGVPHDVKGESVICFAVLRPGFTADDALRRALMTASPRPWAAPSAPTGCSLCASCPRRAAPDHAPRDPGDLSWQGTGRSFVPGEPWRRAGHHRGSLDVHFRKFGTSRTSCPRRRASSSRGTCALDSRLRGNDARLQHRRCIYEQTSRLRLSRITRHAWS